VFFFDNNSYMNEQIVCRQSHYAMWCKRGEPGQITIDGNGWL